MTTSTLWQVGPDGTCTYPAPLPHVRFAFPVRGTCTQCDLRDVVCTSNMVCALCVMTGRA